MIGLAFIVGFIAGALTGAFVMMMAAFRREEIDAAVQEPPDPPMGIGA